jgi:glycosyltransferase involved in cell wall biosynthesis
MEPLRIAFLDPLGLPYDGNTLNNRGLGGSESATILVAQELSKIGFEVTIFNHCDHSGMYDLVQYEDISFFDKSNGSTEVPHVLHQDIVVVLRTVEPFLDPKYHALMTCAKFKVVMCHDTFLQHDARAEDLLVNGVIDEMFVLSDFQNYYMSTCHHGGRRRNPEVLKNKIFQTRNGVVRHIQEVDVTQKDKNLFVYNSSVTKGMVPLVQKIWPLIKNAIPEAKLTVIGGYYKFAEGNKPDEQEQNWRKMSSNPINLANGIEFLGIIKQDEIAKILSKATYFLYPGAFPETFGISTLEALSYNVIPITTKFGALEETAVEKASYLIDYAIEPNNLYPEINTDLQIQKFVEMTVRAYNTPYLNMQKQQYANIVHEVSSWSSVALQWKAHFVKKLGKYLPVDEYRRVQKINTRVHEIFGRRFSNPEEWASYKTVPEQRIHVIAPFYNAADYIEECIWSIATQDYDDYRVTLIDDASTDGGYALAALTLSKLPDDIRKKFALLHNDVNKGAVENQVTAIRGNGHPNLDIIMMIDGDDKLAPRNDIFQFYNTLYADGAEFTYGSSWSMVDNIPLVAQPYPKDVKENKAYRTYKFAWGVPYTHLRTFRQKLLGNIKDDSSFKDKDGKWYRAGGDTAIFYSVIEAANPDKIRAVQDITYLYNDKNPNCDYKIHAEEQTMTANAIAPSSKKTNADILSTSVFNMKPPRKFVGLEKWKNLSGELLAEAKPPLEWKKDEKVVMKDVTVPQFVPNIKPKTILIAIPTAKYIEPETFKSIYDLIIPSGYTVEFQYFYGYVISQVRNLVAHWGLRYDYLFCVDSDIVFESNTLVKMLNSGKNIISGCYVQRLHNNTLELFEANGLGGVKPISTDRLNGKLIQIDACGFGCVLINSQVLRDMKYPWFVYHEALDHKDTISEDIYFAAKAKEAGYTLYADTSIICKHIGSHYYVPITPNNGLKKCLTVSENSPNKTFSPRPTKTISVP